jgi:hypothetical protein
MPWRVSALGSVNSALMKAEAPVRRLSKRLLFMSGVSVIAWSIGRLIATGCDL